MTGIVGFKPTFGRVTRRGVIPMCNTMDHCGPLAKTVEDAALVLNSIAGYDPEDPTSINAPRQDFAAKLSEDLEGVRIGVERQHFLSSPVVQSVREAFETALGVLEHLGAILIDIQVPFIEAATAAGGMLLMADMSAYHHDWIRQKAPHYASGTRFMLTLGERVTAGDYLRALNIRKQLKASMRDAFEQNRLTVLVTPTHFDSAIPLTERFPNSRLSGEEEYGEIKFNHHCMPFNLTGQPALTVPCGLNERGLPIGLQIAGRPFQESEVLRIGRAYEGATDWHERSPPN